MEQQPKYISVNDIEGQQREERQKRHWARREAYSSRSGLLTSLILARAAISLAVRAEPNRLTRRFRRGMLLSRFNRFAGDLARMSLFSA